MEKYIDLHTHSTCSDGTLSPRELVKKASEIGLTAIALTDHDTIKGLTEAIDSGLEYGIEVVTGIEFSVETDTEMHILGLDFNLDCPQIRNVLDKLIDGRKKKNEETIRKLNDLGIAVSMSDAVSEATSEVVGRSQIAKAMIKKGYVSSISEAFDKYLYYGRPAFVRRKSLSPEKVISIIKESGGKSVLAHLNQLKKNDDDLFATLSSLKNFGLDGIEGFYTEYTDDMSKKYRSMAEKLDLKLSGGSDFHGSNKENYNLGIGHGNLKIPYELLEKLRN